MKATTISGETQDAATATLQRIGDVLDRLITIDRKGGGAVDNLYREARRRAGKPLTMRAACEIRNRVKRGSVAALCTAAFLPGPSEGHRFKSCRSIAHYASSEKRIVQR